MYPYDDQNSDLFDIEAKITFFTTEDGGRSTPANSGYRPQFFYDGHDWDAVHSYGTVEKVAPGETVTAYMIFLSPECHVGRLYPGKEFCIREGQRTVGRGVVVKALHLEEHARGKRCENRRQGEKHN